MTVQTLNVGSLTGDEGYLLDPSDWNEKVAETFAAEEDIALTDEHWRVIRFVREWYSEHGVAPSSRDAVMFMKNSGLGVPDDHMENPDERQPEFETTSPQRLSTRA